MLWAAPVKRSRKQRSKLLNDLSTNKAHTVLIKARSLASVTQMIEKNGRHRDSRSRKKTKFLQPMYVYNCVSKPGHVYDEAPWYKTSNSIEQRRGTNRLVPGGSHLLEASSELIVHGGIDERVGSAAAEARPVSGKHREEELRVS